MATFYLSNVLGTLLLPPGTFLLLLLAGWFSPWRWLKRICLGLSFFGLYLLSTAWCAGWLQKSLEIAPPLSLSALPRADAIVVLGGGRHVDMPEYGGDTVNELTLERLRYAAQVYKAKRLPILVSGGMPGGGSEPEGKLMKGVLEHDYGIPVKWTETHSLTTWDNAANSAPILKRAGIKRIFLVTHASDLRRAVPVFRQQGLEVVPAGTRFAHVQIDNPFIFLPEARSLMESTWALHEWLGLVWYKLRAHLAGQGHESTDQAY
ncbi:MAG TPA: YdcF family protein [Thiobacillaceae bacterium]|nr:YdcF family protein [Thiobacillaceae bacterium]